MAKAKTVESTKTRKWFSFQLTTEETAKKGLRAAELAVEIVTKEEEANSVKDKFKGEVATLRREQAGLHRTIRAGSEQREVDCEEVKDWDRLLVEWKYKGDVMESRPMTAEERQVKLKLVSAKDAKPLSAPIAEVMREETSRKTKQDASTA